MKRLEKFRENRFWWEGPSFFSIPRFIEYSSNREQDFFNELKICTLLIDNIPKESPADLRFEHTVDINKFSCLLKLKRITEWILRFVNNLKSRLFNKNTVMTPFLNLFELDAAEQIWIKENKKSLNEKKLKALCNDLNLICGENGLIRCEGRLKFAPLPYDAKTPYLINSEHFLVRLIVEYLHSGLKHVAIIQTLSELGQKFWICRSRVFVRKVLKDWTLGSFKKYVTVRV